MSFANSNIELKHWISCGTVYYSEWYLTSSVGECIDETAESAEDDDADDQLLYTFTSDTHHLHPVTWLTSNNLYTNCVPSRVGIADKIVSLMRGLYCISNTAKLRGYKRKPGRPRKNWVDVIKRDLKNVDLTWEEAEELVNDKAEWRRRVAQCSHLDEGWTKV